MRFAFRHVCVETWHATLPDEVVTSAEIERRLAPLYARLRLPEGRLELMSGIRERRFWPRGTLASQASIASGAGALAAAPHIDPADVGALVHASVCRDHLEPATAVKVHHHLGLGPDAVVYDVSNACLGVLNGMLQVAALIELGQARAGLVVATESGRALVETTIDELNRNTALSRQDIKLAVASLTIGSASVAVLLCHESLSRTGNRLLGGVAGCQSAHHDLCHGGHDEASPAAAGPLMTTDSERLLVEGVRAAEREFARFTQQLGWQADAVQKTFCHQVGVAHRRLLLERLALDPARDFTTLEFLGNTGSAALPVTACLGERAGHVAPGDRVALLGIGSGINVVMLGVDWQTVATPGGGGGAPPATRAANLVAR